MAASDASGVTSSRLKRNSDDMAWEFAMLIDPDDLQRVMCKLCGKVMSGGVTRMKQHIAQIKGSVTSCMQATLEQQARCKDAYEAPKKKKQKLQEENEVRALVMRSILRTSPCQESIWQVTRATSTSHT